MTTGPRPNDSRNTVMAPAGSFVSVPYFKGLSHRFIAALAFAMLLMVCAVGWFQYEQIDRITLSSVKGKDNIVWDFYKLEILLMDYQTALRQVIAHPGKPGLLSAVYTHYNLFASQIQTASATNSGQIMNTYASFKTAIALSGDYIAGADAFLEPEPRTLELQVAQSLLEQSVALRTALHKVVLEAYQVENARATRSWLEMRRFTYLYGISSFFLVVLALATGVLTLRRFVLNDRLQFERAKLLREKKEAAEAANKAKARFLSSASHDLRQPAHALGLFMERIEQVADDPLAKALVANAMTAVREMQDMLDSMFDLSHLDSGSVPTNIRAFPIQDVFESVRSVLESDALAKGLRLRFRPSALWLESDSAMLRRIVLNLVSNAIRYTESGTVLVACRPAAGAGHARIEVRDSGIGIAQEDQEKVFQEFYQVANPQRDRRFGMGVGLSVVDRCCRLLKHPLTLCSSLGAGTRISLTVPLGKALPDASRIASSPELPGEAFTSVPILLIEDDEMGRVALTGLLESWGYSVRAAESAQRAVEQWYTLPRPAIIISDYRLGGGTNGVEAIRLLRNLSGTDVAACLISGDTSTEVQQLVKASGLTLLSKPVRPGKLRSLLRHLAAKDAAAPAT